MDCITFNFNTRNSALDVPTETETEKEREGERERERDRDIQRDRLIEPEGGESGRE